VRPAITIMNGSGSSREPAPAFASLYHKLIPVMTKVFPPGENPDSIYPPESAREFVNLRFANAPEFHRQLAVELWTVLQDLQLGKRRVNEKTLRDHQFAHLIWLAASITDGQKSPKSFFIQGAPGTGKTLTLGVVMQACIRLQMRGRMAGKIAYCTAKPYHLSDKVRGKGMGRRRILRAPPYLPNERDIQRRRQALCRIDGPFMKKYFPKAAFQRLFAQRPATLEQARELVSCHLQSCKATIDASEAPMLENVLQVLASMATLVRGPFGSVEILTFPPIPEEAQRLVSHTGDAAFAIPHDYPLFTRDGIGVANCSRADARVVLEPASVFTSAQQIGRFQQELHRHIRVVLCDEAQRRQPIAFQEPVVAAGAEHSPLVFAAGSQWYGKSWDRRSPAHSFPESIRRGILPDLGVRLFPSAEDLHYPAETEEALRQLMHFYAQPLDSFKALGLPQPFHVNTLVVVHARLVDLYVERLRQAYEKLHPSAAVRPFHGDEEDREALQIWFDTSGDGPHVLVSSASVVKESLDLLSLRHLIVATRVSPDVLYHLIGRLAHGRGRQSPKDRMLVTLQQFANGNLSATPFVALDHGQELPEDGFAWINGHALMSHKAYQDDSRRLKKGRGRDRVKVPGHRRVLRGQQPPIKMTPGKSILPGNVGELIDPASRTAAGAIAGRLALVSVVPEAYDPEKGPPSRELARFWAAECGGLSIFDTYPSIMLSMLEAHNNGCCPRQALEQKIAQLRERGRRANA